MRASAGRLITVAICSGWLAGVPAWSQAPNSTNPTPRPPGGTGTGSAPTARPTPPSGLGGAIAPPTAPSAAAPSPATPKAAPIQPAAVAPPPQQPPAPTLAAPNLGAFALAQNATGFEATNIVFRIGPVTYSIPRAEIAGTSLSREDLARLLDPSSGAPAAERLTRLQATSISIPELFSALDAPGGRQAAVYRDVRLDGLAGGRLPAVTSGSGNFEAVGKAGLVRGGFSRMDIAEIDLGLAVALFDERAGEGKGELRPVYGSFAIEGLASSDPKGVTIRMARLVGRDLLARRTKDGWTETMRRLAAAPDPAKASPEERSSAFNALVDLFEAFEVGSVEATGIAFQDPGAKEAAGRIARIAYRGGVGRPAEFSMEGLEAGGSDNRVQIASLSIGGFTIGPTLEAARDLTGRQPDEMSAAELRRLVPGLGSVRLTGVEVETKATGQPQRVALGSFELMTEKPIEGIPSDIRLAVRNVAAPIAKASSDEGAKQLAELGYERIDASLAANLAWNEPGQEIVLRELSARGLDMGSIVLRGVVGNVTRDLFAPDQALASVALVGATVKSVDIGVENGGLFERIVAREARRQKKSPDDIRREYGMAAAIGVPIMLGNSAAAKTLGQALGRFVAKPGRLAIQARVRDPAGLGFADFAGSPDPSQLLDKIDITATSE